MTYFYMATVLRLLPFVRQASFALNVNTDELHTDHDNDDNGGDT